MASTTGSERAGQHRPFLPRTSTAIVVLLLALGFALAGLHAHAQPTSCSTVCPVCALVHSAAVQPSVDPDPAPADAGPTRVDRSSPRVPEPRCDGPSAPRGPPLPV